MAAGIEAGLLEQVAVVRHVAADVAEHVAQAYQAIVLKLGVRPPLAALQRMQAGDAVVALEPLMQRKNQPRHQARPQRALRRRLEPGLAGFVHSHGSLPGRGPPAGLICRPKTFTYMANSRSLTRGQV